MPKYKTASTLNAMDKWHNVQSTAAGFCKTGERMSREAMARTRKREQHLPPPNPRAQLSPEEKAAQEDAIMLRVKANLEKQFGKGTVMVRTTRTKKD